MSPPDLIKAIRKGSLSEVRAALLAGAQVEPDGGAGVPGLALGIACFMGHADIVRELVKQGGKVNMADNREPTSPLSMAIRGERTEIVRLLVELGAIVPPGMDTGLTGQELTVAQWKSGRTDVAGALPSAGAAELPLVEEIVMLRALGTDTMTLDAEVIRVGMELEAKKKREQKTTG